MRKPVAALRCAVFFALHIHAAFTGFRYWLHDVESLRPAPLWPGRGPVWRVK